MQASRRAACFIPASLIRSLALASRLEGQGCPWGGPPNSGKRGPAHPRIISIRACRARRPRRPPPGAAVRASSRHLYARKHAIPPSRLKQPFLRNVLRRKRLARTRAGHCHGSNKGERCNPVCCTYLRKLRQSASSGCVEKTSLRLAGRHQPIRYCNHARFGGRCKRI